jgi:hypothetical protein
MLRSSLRWKLEAKAAAAITCKGLGGMTGTFSSSAYKSVTLIAKQFKDT